MRKLAICTVALTAVAALAVPAPAVTTRSVKVGDNYYVRDSGVPTVTVKRNTKVIWRFLGRSAHTVTSSGPVKFTSTTRTAGTYSRTMTRTGYYRIYCKIHGRSDQSMTLRVTK